MIQFSDLYTRMQHLNEVKESPWAGSHPGFTGITKKFREAGMPSAPLDTISFIRNVLFHLDIIDEETETGARKVNGFTAKKQALLGILASKSEEIIRRADEIQAMIEEDLPKYIKRATLNRSALTSSGEVTPHRAEKYQTNAENLKQAKEMAAKAKQIGDSAPDQESKDAMDVIATGIENAYDESNVQSAMVKTTIAKVLQDIQDNLGEEGFDIDPEALEEVVNYADRINSLAQLESFVKQIAAEPGYEKIAAYLSAAIKPLRQHEKDHAPKPEATEEPLTFPAPEDAEEVVSESYTGMYLSEQTHHDKYTKKPVVQTISTRDKLKPKTSWQAQSLRSMS